MYELEHQLITCICLQKYILRNILSDAIRFIYIVVGSVRRASHQNLSHSVSDERACVLYTQVEVTTSFLIVSLNEN